MMTNQAPGNIILLGKKNADGQFTPWAGQISFSLDQEKELIENGDKSTAGDKNLVGKKSWSASLDQLYRGGIDGFDDLNEAYESDELIDVQVIYPNGSKKEGQAHMVSMSESWAKDSNDPISVSLTGEGLLVFTKSVATGTTESDYDSGYSVGFSEGDADLSAGQPNNHVNQLTTTYANESVEWQNGYQAGYMAAYSM